LHSAPRFLVETVFICIPLVMIILTRNKAGFGHSILPLLGLYAYAGFRAIPSFNRITMHVNNIRYGGAVADSLYDDFNLLGIAQDRSHHEDIDQHLSFEHSLSAEDVCFSYDEKTGYVLKDLSLTIKRGEYIAIAGATGAGKSTIIDIILGLIPPSSGKITVDGIDISNKVSAWRKKIGYVPQDIYLTDDTLRRNIAFGISDEEISENKVLEALRLAQLGDFVASLPKGLDTVTGERGVTLSGGEKQRVAVARALYLNPEILIFDEATSALDSHTEQKLADAIRSLRGHTTIILVAHRIQTIKNCDRIIFIRNKRIEATGGWDELLKSSPEFCKLVNE
jgi:ATP-binding cassette subfamily C protein